MVLGIVRISGPQALVLAEKITKKIFTPRKVLHTEFFDDQDQVIDAGLAIYFQAPNSFTGEDVVELHGHGGPVILDCLLERVIGVGARMAEPGEFSKRAFLNNKLDLVQAEAVADLINAQTKQEARAAVRSLQGSFSEVIRGVVEKLIQLRMFVESAIDFPEEEIDFLGEANILARIDRIVEKISSVLAKAKSGLLLSEGIKAVIIGKTNAGKSSLLNLLCGEDTAIVTELPGTTRDIIKEQVCINGVRLDLLDTAGLRDTNDLVEQEGIRRAWDAVGLADLVIVVVDGEVERDTDPYVLYPDWVNKFPKEAKVLVAYNKIDKINLTPAIKESPKYTVVNISAKTGLGLSHFKEALLKLVGAEVVEENIILARRRHLEALRAALMRVQAGRVQAAEYKAGELLAEELRLAQQELSAITGEFRTDDLLGRIFAEFCVGK